MKSRALGIALIALAVLGVLNLYQAVARGLDSSEGVYAEDYAIAVADAGDESEETDFNFKFDFKFASDSDDDQAGDRMIDETFSVSAGDLLLIDVQHSDIEIETTSGSEAHIVVTLESRNMDRAREIFDRMNFRVEKRGDKVILRSDMPRRMNWRTRMNIEVLAVIPSEFDLDIQSTHGDVEVQDLTGNVRLKTTHGDISTGSFSGDSVELRTTHGDVETKDVQGSTVTIRTTHGDIELRSVISDDFEATTTHSDIEILRLTGHSSLSTTHGDVDVRVDDTESLTIRTTHGDIDIVLPAGLAADLDLRGDRVVLPSDSNFSGTLQKKSANGSINGGGADIEVTTTHGTVVIKTR